MNVDTVSCAGTLVVPRWMASRLAPALALAVGLTACGGAPDDPDGWPLSEIESADSLFAANVPESPEGALDDEESGGTSIASAAAPTAGTADPVSASVASSSTTPAPPAPRPYRPPSWLSPDGPIVEPSSETIEDVPDARFPRPEYVRGLYVNAWAAGSSARMAELIDVAQRTEVNAFVIDIKDATGFVSHDTNVELAKSIGADGEIRIRDLPGLLDRLEAAGIYPIARIVVVKDPILAAAVPETAVQDTAGGVWIDSKEIIWQNLFNEQLWTYNVDIAREVAELGFPEIQWDYIRFPDAPVSDLERAVFTGGEDRPRVDAVRGFLAYARDELSDLSVRSTADVFGVTTSFRRDIGIGQLWETFIDVVDVALPMVYPSHYWEWSFGYDHPNAYPYEVVYAALRDALRRSEAVDGAGMTRPWLQDFTLGAPAYGPAEVRAQIQATYDVGLREWILWNPSTRYSLEALEPVGGFEQEPLIRVAGMLSPVSRRLAVMDSVAVYAQAVFDAQAAQAIVQTPPTAQAEASADTGVTVAEPGSPSASPEPEPPVPIDTVTADTLRVDLSPRGRPQSD